MPSQRIFAVATLRGVNKHYTCTYIRTSVKCWQRMHDITRVIEIHIMQTRICTGTMFSVCLEYLYIYMWCHTWPRSDVRGWFSHGDMVWGSSSSFAPTPCINVGAQAQCRALPHVGKYICSICDSLLLAFSDTCADSYIVCGDEFSLMVKKLYSPVESQSNADEARNWYYKIGLVGGYKLKSLLCTIYKYIRVAWIGRLTAYVESQFHCLIYYTIEEIK